MKYRWDHGLGGLAYDGSPELYAAQQGASFLESLVKEVIFQVTHCALTCTVSQTYYVGDQFYKNKQTKCQYVPTTLY